MRLQGACQGFNASIVSIHAPTQGATTSPNGRRRSTQRFNPRTHAGCDHRPPRVAIAAVAFQSTHPRRVRLEWVSRFFMPSRVFQSTHPRRVRRSAAAIPCSICCFNPRTHAGCDISSGGFPNRSRSFNPRTHAGCDACWAAGRYACIGFQSTHPRRVRPARRVGRIAANRVSIHAPTQGATPPSGRSSGSGMSFQSTHPRRVRRYGAEIASLKADVSIHAPTQGATRVVQSPFFASPSFNPRTHAGCDVARRGGLGDSHGFNPRTHAGCDVTIKTHQGTQAMFQSTHPRRVRRFLWPLAAGYTLRFNPRTHAGCDGMVVTVTTIRRMFQSTHPRRVRRMASPVIWLPPVSIHAPTQGATFVRLEHRAARVVSIHAPTQGATRASPALPAAAGCFNPRTHAGCD